MSLRKRFLIFLFWVSDASHWLARKYRYVLNRPDPYEVMWEEFRWA